VSFFWWLVLLIDVLFIAINMSCKLKEKQKTSHFLDNLMEEHVVVGF
jgi:hypothetical protein